MFLFSKRISIFLIIKIFFFTKNKIDQLKKKYLFNNQKLILFNRSRWSLLFIVFLYKKFLKKKSVNIWVPSYFCNYALSKMKYYYKDIKFIYYPINKNLNLDIGELRKINIKKKIDIFIKVNYFGKEFDNLELTNLLNENKSWLINDCTHCITAKKGFEKQSDFSIYSPHKFYSIPSGAICKINYNGINKKILNEKLININDLKKEFIKELNLSSFKIYFFDFFSNLFWMLKRLISFFYRKIKIMDFENNHEQNYSDFDNKPFPSFFTKKLMINTIVLDTHIINERKKTFYLWKQIVKKILDNKFEYSFILEDLEEPYNLILKSDEKNVKKIYKMLKDYLIPISTWPDLPGKIRFDSLYNETFQLRNNLIFLNLHPQINQQLKFLNTYNYNSKYYNISKHNHYKIVKILSNDEWEVYLKQVKNSYVTSINNYYQSYKFLKYEKFIIVDEHDKKIGIFQICLINIGKFSFIRLNLGPCFFSSVEENVKKEVINVLLTDLYPNKIKFFYISPNLKFNEQNIFFYHKNHISIYSGIGWNSIKLDLQKSLKILKDQLKGSLRRDIKKKNITKKINVKAVISSNEFSIFIKNYKRQKIKKNFKGIDEKTLQNLFLNKKLIILNAYSETKIISTVCIAVHGKSATYLVGLNLYKFETANDLLLWKVIIFLKKNNFLKFDLGGIDFENNKNVSIFKSNFGGKKYKLVGSKFVIT